MTESANNGGQDAYAGTDGTGVGSLYRVVPISAAHAQASLERTPLPEPYDSACTALTGRRKLKALFGAGQEEVCDEDRQSVS